MLGVLLVCWGSYLIIQRVAFGLSMGEVRGAWHIYDGVGNTHRVSRGVGSLVVGAALFLGGRFIAVRTIVVPARGCPRCGYAGSASGRCPECGLNGLRPAGDGEGG